MADKTEWKQKMLSGLNCSQCVFGAFADRFDYAEEEFHRIAAGFGGGMTRGDTCGAVTGGIMALGLAFGDDPDRLHENVHRLQQEFSDRFGSTVCRELLGFDFSAPGQGRESMTDDAEEKCAEFVMEAARMIEKLLDE